MTHHPHPHGFCPHCGYDLRLDTPILIDDFSMMSSISMLRWKGEVIPMTSSERIICYALMKAYPSPVRIMTLLERLDSEATGNVIDVFICRIRKKLKAVGAPNAVATLRNRGRERAFIWTTGNKGDYVPPNGGGERW